jgi:hypothetical protein
MADTFLTLLDITKQNGTDQAVGIVEEVRTYAPEIDVLRGRPIRGTTYKALVRTALPGGPTFRRANEGTAVVASRWDQRVNQTFFLDAQMRVDEAILDASEFGPEWVMANEASGVAKQKMIALGSQFYYGLPSTTDFGFPGLLFLYDPAAMEVTANAKASLSNTTSSAWLVVNQPDCCEFIYGNNQGLQLKQWTPQYVTGTNSQYRAFLNNLSGYIGLSFNYTKSVVRIKNLTADGTASTQGLNDNLIAQAIALFPVGTVPTHIFCSRKQRLRLQTSRSPVLTTTTGKSAITASTALQFSSIPTESNGIPIFVTDSISDVEYSTDAATVGNGATSATTPSV